MKETLNEDRVRKKEKVLFSLAPFIKEREESGRERKVRDMEGERKEKGSCSVKKKGGGVEKWEGSGGTRARERELMRKKWREGGK